MTGTAEIIDRARRACHDAAAQLSSAGVDREALAEYIPPKRVLLRMRPATMRNLGEVWRLGPLLISGSGTLLAAGKVTRSAERGRPSYHSLSREERRNIAAAALRGGYPEGTTVNYGAAPLLLDQIAIHGREAAVAPAPAPGAGAGAGAASAPASASAIGFVAGNFHVRWSPNAALQTSPTLADFLAERVTLLIKRTEEAL